jgi:AAA+ superfamily predicted ATPase
MTDPLVSSLLAAVAATPQDVPLRLHVAGVLLERGRPAQAAELCSTVLQGDDGNTDALILLARATEALTRSAGPADATPANGTAADTTAADTTAADGTAADGTAAGAGPGAGAGPAGPGAVEFDWSAAEEQVRDIVPPPLLEAEPGPPAPDTDLEPSGVRLTDVGGLDAVKQRLEIAFLGPMRNPELARLYGKSLAGGLLLYGPPGCGKTFIARAVAGELGAQFYAVSLADILDHYLGDTERNVRAIFDTARRNAPCVLFLDEVDAIGHRRSRIGSGWSGMRGAVNQLLHEMDSVANPASDRRDGVFVLAATNHPWDIDPALRRPGRLDRTILVLPPDRTAREAILRFHLQQRPLAGIDVAAIAQRTADFSGADLAHLCDTAAELALESSVRTGQVRPIDMSDVDAALRQLAPSTGPWLQTARNVAMFANSGGEYDDLLAYLKAKKLV